MKEEKQLSDQLLKSLNVIKNL